jgi:hypothetical protein
MTGRGAGFCTGYAAGYANFGPPWSCWGGGRGWRNRYYATGLTGWQRAGIDRPGAGAPFGAPVSRELEFATLKNQAENLTQALDAIRKQIETLEARDRKDAQ